MTDTSNNTVDPQQISEQEEASQEEARHLKTPTMTESDHAEMPPAGTVDSETRKSVPNFSFSIWPPTRRTREAVTRRLIETLSSPSVLSKRYGVIPSDEASEAAKRIEEEAYASASSSTSSDDDGIEILQLYSKEISRLMLDTVKSRSGSAPAAAADVSPVPEDKPQEDAATAKEEEDAAAKTES